MVKRFLVAAAASLTMVAAGLTASAAQAQNACQDNISQVLAEYGVKISEIANPTWQTQYWQHRGGNGPVSGFQFYGTPASCSDGGSLYVSVTTGCEISDMHTDGNCKIRGIPHYWW